MMRLPIGLAALCLTFSAFGAEPTRKSRVETRPTLRTLQSGTMLQRLGQIGAHFFTECFRKGDLGWAVKG